MIVGIGTDIVDIDRIRTLLSEQGARFIDRCFASVEQKYAADHPSAPAHYAKRFAAKEAGAKALGTGIREGIYLRDIVVGNDVHGAPFLTLHGAAAERLTQMAPAGPKTMHLSLSDERGHALAFVMIEALSDSIKPIISPP